jgi:hypothetical protein
VVTGGAHSCRSLRSPCLFEDAGLTERLALFFASHRSAEEFISPALERGSLARSRPLQPFQFGRIFAHGREQHSRSLRLGIDRLAGRLSSWAGGASGRLRFCLARSKRREECLSTRRPAPGSQFFLVLDEPCLKDRLCFA